MKHKNLSSRLIIKNRYLLLLLCMCISTLSFTQNMLYVSEISFEEVEQRCLLLSADSELSDIPEYDIPKFEFEKVEFNLFETINSEGNVSQTRTLLSSVNCYEEWEGLDNQWIMDENGFSAFDLNNDGQYELSSFQSNSESRYNIYQEWNSTAHQFGLLTNKVFPQNIDRILDNNGQDYQTTLDGQVYIINENTITVWIAGLDVSYIYTLEYSDVVESLSYNGVIETTDLNLESYTITIFDLWICKEQFKTSSVTINKTNLTNGLCAKEVVETYYNNYTFEDDCNRPDIRSKNKTSDDDLIVFPNPASSSSITVVVPNTLIGQDAVLEVKSIDGKSMLKKSINIDQNEIRLEVGNVLPTSGLYIVSISQNEVFQTSKFYYLRQ